MKVFLSSVISGFEHMRTSARQAIESLGHQPLMAEDFQAQTSSPQVTCLKGVREADVVVLVVGERYGAIQPSGLSATHEEYREAQGRKPVLAFVQDGCQREQAQRQFLDEVEGWEAGVFRSGFTSAEDLGPKLTRALHEWQLANAVGPLNAPELLERALQLLPNNDRSYMGSDAVLRVAFAAGPSQTILRPVQIEAASLREQLLEASLFGAQRIFDPGIGTSAGMRGSAIALSQEGNGRTRGSILLNPQGDLLLELSLPQESQRSGIPVMIEEGIKEKLGAALRYADWVYEKVDQTQRLTHLVVATKLAGSGFAWRTRAEHAASPNQVTHSIGFGDEHLQSVHLSPAQITRAALRMDMGHIVEDLLALLRRQWHSSNLGH